MDSGAWINWNNITNTSWTWVQLSTTLSLSAGSHTLTVAYREDGAQLDKLNITTSTTTPTGTGETASNLCMPKMTADDEELNRGELPKEFELAQNYPNPFNPTTVISFTIPENYFVSLKVYDLLGTEIAELAGREYSAGWHSITFDASNFASGVYFYTFKAGQYTSTQRMIFQK
jgi:hypothetical protein